MDKALRNTLLFIAVACVAAVALGLYTAYRKANSPEAMRAIAYKSGMTSCTEKATAAVKGTAVTPAQVDHYCSCATGKLVNSYSVDEMKAIAKDHSILSNPQNQQRMQTIILACRAETLGASQP